MYSTNHIQLMKIMLRTLLETIEDYQIYANLLYKGNKTYVSLILIHLIK